MSKKTNLVGSDAAFSDAELKAIGEAEKEKRVIDIDVDVQEMASAAPLPSTPDTIATTQGEPSAAILLYLMHVADEEKGNQQRHAEWNAACQKRHAEALAVWERIAASLEKLAGRPR